MGARLCRRPRLPCRGAAAAGAAGPSPLGLDRDSAEHVRATALLVALWVALFAWPVLLALPDPPGPKLGWGWRCGPGWRRYSACCGCCRATR
ncbi:hypothetical protein ACFQU2_23750 [Siccirubricoccus deserti]